MSTNHAFNSAASEAVDAAAEDQASTAYRMPEWLLTKIRGAPEVLEALLNAPLERP